ncbi:MAG: G5 domain-containing protein [[Eubacterium] sulci]|nr:G5 domain-containing protein [[Eubacterium] sulci]MBF1178592.1 G5 domain-containing protein [[Eubacterium] sulci]MBF1182424.1 G5 domain-containing protein [[Eubacterium] sulci]
MSIIKEIKSRKDSVLILALIVTLVLSTTIISSAMTASSSTVDYWQLKLGKKTVAVFDNESDAKNVIEQVKAKYVAKGANVEAVEIDPALTVDQITVKASDEQPKVEKDTKKLVDKLLGDEKASKTYTVQDGDTLWDIAAAFGTDVDTILAANPNVSLESLMPGDVIKFSSKSSLLTVTVKEKVTSERAVEFDTVYEDTDALYEGEEEVKTEGVQGTEKVTEVVTKSNGAVVSTKVLSAKTVKAPESAVVLRGTKAKETPAAQSSSSSSNSSSSSSRSSSSRSYAGSSSSGYSANGNTVLSAAYSQLGVGQDCTSLVSNSLAAAGIYFHGWPQQYASLGSWTSNPVPGDIVIYDTHVAIYAGGGTAVHGGWNGGTTGVGPVYCSANLMGYIHIG